MNFTERLQLDNLFSINKLGEVYAENPVSANIWQTDKHDYVTIVVSERLEDRFQAFWNSARMVLEDKLRVHHVQHGTPFFGDYSIHETWYFITVEGARGLLEKFYSILPEKMPGIHM